VGAGGSQANTAGQGGSNDRLLVEPDAVPALRNAFADAMAKLDQQITLVDAELGIEAWASDPVSAEAAAAYNAKAADSSAMLRAYRDQLSAAVDTLGRTAEQYRLADEDNSVTVGKQEGTGG
jgi:hypothetical protein